MENRDISQASIDTERCQSSDADTEVSIVSSGTLSIDTTQPEAGKYPLPDANNKKVVQTEPIGQSSNISSQTTEKQGTEIPVKSNSTLDIGKEIKLPLQDYLNPNRTYSNRSAIRIPDNVISKTKFNADYYNMMRRNPFKGSSLEHPQDHIEGLEELIPDEYIRCRLFPFSLEGGALRWLNCLPRGSLTSWKEIRNAFLKQFFDDTRYWEVRRRISTFRQDPQESFKNAWGRFKSYELECLHHGYPEPQFLKIFYKGVILSYKTTLDTTSEGNFVTRNPMEARRLIENMARGSFTRDYEICIQSRIGREKYNLKQALTGNRKMKFEFNGKVNSVYGELNQKMDSLIEHLRGMEDKIANLATTLKRETGRLPGRTDANPGAKRQAYAVMLRSGKHLETNSREDVRNKKLIDNAEKSNSNPIELLDNDSDSETSEQRKNSSNEKNKGKTMDLDKENPDAEDKIDHLDEPHIDRSSGKENDRPSGTSSSNTQSIGTERVYRAPPPFPPNKPQTKKALEHAICKKAFDKINFEASLSDALKIAPSVKKYMKDMISSSGEQSVMLVSEEVSAIIQGGTSIKRSDPGSFVLDCKIQNARFPRSLCDLGSSVNLMPHSVAVSLGYDVFVPTPITLVLADRSIRVPEGILVDMPVEIDGCSIPADFVVLKYKQVPKDPLILGRPFLATSGAIIDCRGGKLI
ncbi:uncharacterized protein LOC108858341 [Raphanus sativus]|uniref:Uncharacterized protein LOC108858341 n=1 Tax=Raphanus sativus TaxID=3726 RepID=A0A9W3BR31_RAPSA|nr:uncharacterized protein LOC108858341 [Raphanus sativus]